MENINEDKLNNLIYKKICEDILKHNKSHLNESVSLNESVVSTLKSYYKKGLLTTAVIMSLLNGNIATAQEFEQAGIPIEQSMLSEKGDYKKLEAAFLKLLKNRNRINDARTYTRYNQLNDEEKNGVLKYIDSRIESFNDLKLYTYNIFSGKPEDFGEGKNTIFRINKNDNVQLSTYVTTAELPNLSDYFKNNSPTLSDSESLTDSLKSALSVFHAIDKIEIITSSNTLRNRGDLANTTWLESSEMRANAIKDLLVGMGLNLTENDKFTIEADIIELNFTGDNGDGTSGPKSPYEVADKYIQSYNERNIDEKFWRSNATENPLSDIKEYEKFNTVTIKVYGELFEENECEIPSYKDFQMVKFSKGKPDGGKADITKSKKKIPDAHKGAIKCNKQQKSRFK